MGLTERKGNSQKLAACSANSISGANGTHDDGEPNDEKYPQLLKRKLVKALGPEREGDTDDEDIDFTETTKPGSSVQFVGDEAEDARRQTYNETDDGDTDGIANRGAEDDSFGTNDDDEEMQVAPSSLPVQTLQLPEAQPPFAPSATPLDLSRRFLCWNHIGTITTTQGEGRNSVGIQFHDSGFRARSTINFTDTMGFIVGVLGEEGGLFASDLADEDDDGDDEDLRGVVDGLQMSEQTKAALKRSHTGKKGHKATGSTVYFHRFETIGSRRDKDWFLTLASGERVLGCACGAGWSAVVTSRRFLRLFTSGGNQDLILWLAGDPVTMVGRSRFLAVFYHVGQPEPDLTQKLGYLLYDAIGNRAIAKGTMSCISPRSSLQWVGFSAEHSLFAMDSSGVLSMLVSLEEGAGWEWMPVLETLELRKSEGDRFWPISVADGKLNCVLLKGGIKYPNAARKPVTSNLGLRLPFARGPIAQTNVLEELSVRASVALQQKKLMHGLAMDGDVDEEFERDHERLSAQVDKVTLKTFAATVETGKLEKALDLVERLYLEKSFEIAKIVAADHGRLANMIEGVRDRRFGDSPDHFETPDYTQREENRNLTKISPETTCVPGSKRPFEHDGSSIPPRKRNIS